MKKSDSHSDDPQWQATRALLRKHLVVSPPEHPDFINSQVLEAIRREEAKAPVGGVWSLRRLVWSGLSMLAAALVLALVCLPRDFGDRGNQDFYSQVIASRAVDPGLSVTTFQVPEERGVVLWIEGAEFIPANHRVQ